MVKPNVKIVKKILKEDIKRGKPPVERSPKWPAVRDRHIKNNPTCAACGATGNLQVHHIRPFHLFPELELDSTNLITLCEVVIVDDDKQNDNHHLKLGHGGDFRKYNPKSLKQVNEYRVLKAKLGKLKDYDLRSRKKKL